MCRRSGISCCGAPILVVNTSYTRPSGKVSMLSRESLFFHARGAGNETTGLSEDRRGSVISAAMCRMTRSSKMRSYVLSSITMTRKRLWDLSGTVMLHVAWFSHLSASVSSTHGRLTDSCFFRDRT
jgi:hypothetical protein